MGEVLRLDNLQTALADAVIGDSRATLKAEKNQIRILKNDEKTTGMTLDPQNAT